jgi:hypothetical protein
MRSRLLKTALECVPWIRCVPQYDLPARKWTANCQGEARLLEDELLLPIVNLVGVKSVPSRELGNRPVRGPNSWVYLSRLGPRTMSGVGGGPTQVSLLMNRRT